MIYFAQLFFHGERELYFGRNRIANACGLKNSRGKKPRIGKERSLSGNGMMVWMQIIISMQILGRYYYNELWRDVGSLVRAWKLAEQIIMEIKHAPGSNNFQPPREIAGNSALGSEEKWKILLDLKWNNEEHTLGRVRTLRTWPYLTFRVASEKRSIGG